nr:hypothetical protein [Tanacetum cinerariifolium]
MSSNNAQSAVTYTSISSDSDRPSWGIPLMNASEFPKMEPYKEVAKQGQVEDDDKDLEEDPSKEHEPKDDDEDPEEDPNEEHEPEDSDETEPFEEDETAITPPSPRHHGAKISVRPQTPMAASTQVLIDAFAAGSSLFPLPPTNPAYDQAPLGHKVAMIRRRDDIPEEDMPPQRRFTSTTPSPGCDIAESSTAAAARHLGVSMILSILLKQDRGMTSIEEVNLRVSYQAQVRRQEKLQEVHKAYLSSEARNRALLVRLETLKTHMSRMESVEDLAITQMIRIHTLEARARTDTVEDAGSSC